MSKYSCPVSICIFECELFREKQKNKPKNTASCVQVFQILKAVTGKFPLDAQNSIFVKMKISLLNYLLIRLFNINMLSNPESWQVIIFE